MGTMVQDMPNTLYTLMSFVVSCPYIVPLYPHAHVLWPNTLVPIWCILAPMSFAPALLSCALMLMSCALMPLCPYLVPLHPCLMPSHLVLCPCLVPLCLSLASLHTHTHVLYPHAHVSCHSDPCTHASYPSHPYNIRDIDNPLWRSDHKWLIYLKLSIFIPFCGQEHKEYKDTKDMSTQRV